MPLGYENCHHWGLTHARRWHSGTLIISTLKTLLKNTLLRTHVQMCSICPSYLDMIRLRRESWQLWPWLSSQTSDFPLPCHSYCCLYVLPNWTVLIQAWSCLKKKCVIYFLRSIMYAQLGVFSTVPNLAYHTYINRLNNFFKTETTTVYVFGAHLYITNGQIDSWL